MTCLRSPSDGSDVNDQSGLRVSISAQNACSESVSPTGRNLSLLRRRSCEIPGRSPLWAKQCQAPPSSRTNGWQLREATGPRVALRIWLITSSLEKGFVCMNRTHALEAAGWVSLTSLTSRSSYQAIPQPSLCGPVRPPWRENSSSDRLTVPGCRADIAKSSHIFFVCAYLIGPKSMDLLYRISRP